jgi:hypothetical protein
MFTTATSGQTTTNVESLGVKRFDMDIAPGNVPVDNWVLYDDLNSGSGQSDIAFLVPASAFTGALDSDFVYMYQKFGEHESAESTNTTQGGYEETKFGGSSIQPPTPVPEPTTTLFGVALVAFTGFSRRRIR